MEIKAQLYKPYTETQKINFVAKYNHKLGYQIIEEESSIKALYYSKDEIEKQQKEDIKNLYLTRADVERGIYKAKGLDFEDILELVKNNTEIDLKALKIELKANNFYRGNPYISKIGALLGFSEKQLDKFFESGNVEALNSD